ncbi:phosphate ABC transporter permease PstA [Nocardioides sp. Kera G14]|uniref:phosphate ABC transporter permease PstA n=1 Tax=Nocardioides sp. Kera G14 TaxID=2884264 RepID=UPI001D0FD4EC|nr:phosphate ABC transporter permease PstA [Nocardioides sp. Kera G14]UDY23143.1 phosphate ABC transporter permease PstA [Nocardioides sp. Kera G14]
MTTSQLSPTATLGGARLPAYAIWLALIASFAVAGLLALLLGWGPVPFVLIGGLITLVVIPLWAGIVENRRAAMDRFVTAVIWAAFLVALVPLIWLLYTVIKNGVPGVNTDLLTHDMVQRLNPETGKLEVGGGLYHALIGSLMVTLGAIVISVPIGLFTAIYLTEYAGRNRIGRIITFLVDVMTGIPSIVAGLFALALFSLVFGVGTRMGLMGSIALSLLMIPTVVRSAEEMMRLVPADLREASYALGVPKWRTITKVVIPTAFAGIVTGIVLAISRVIGETAPLLVAVGTLEQVNWNLFDGRMMTLPVFIMTQYSTATPQGYQNAWSAALILIVIVMLLNLVARIISSIFAPKTKR